MTSLQDRAYILGIVRECEKAGVSRAMCCRHLVLSGRTLRRWEQNAQGDRRPDTLRKCPGNALSEQERRHIIDVCNRPENASLPPAQVVADMADQGQYIGSESTIYRVLKSAGMAARRGRARAPRKVGPARTHTASAPKQVWCWDITWLPGPARGLFYRLYLILDLYSRKIVGWEVWEEENSSRAGELLERTCLCEGVASLERKPVLHGDNGSALKAGTLDALLARLKLHPSRSRPRVSNDNAHVEALFRTAKYHQSLPPNGFQTLEDARLWAQAFVNWYNTMHRHRSIKFVTPEQKHQNADTHILAKRALLYQQAKQANPKRWIKGKTRDWTPVSSTTLNPVSERKIEKLLKKSA